MDPGPDSGCWTLSNTSTQQSARSSSSRSLVSTLSSRCVHETLEQNRIEYDTRLQSLWLTNTGDNKKNKYRTKNTLTLKVLTHLERPFEMRSLQGLDMKEKRKLKTL